MPDWPAAERRSGRGTGQTFERSLGALALLSFTLSALSPAASVFITGSELLRLVGTGAAPAIAIGAVIAFIAALLYAEVAETFPHAGGLYAGVERLLGRWASFIILVLSLVTAPAYLAFSGLGLATYLGVLIPALPTLPVAAAAIILASAMAMLRLRANLVAASLFLLIEIVSVVALAGAGAWHLDRSFVAASLAPVRLDPQAGLVPTTHAQMAIAIVAATWACSGTLWGSYLGEDVTEPQGAFGRALAWTGLIGALLVAIPILLAALSIDEPAHTLAGPAPLFTFMTERLGQGIAAAISLGIVLAIFNNLLTMTVALARLLFATGRERLWPAPLNRLLTRIGARSLMPVGATIALAAVSLPLLLAGPRTLLILLSAEIVSPLLIAIAVLVGRRRGLIAAGGYRAPLHPLLPIVGIVIIALFIAADWADPGTGRSSILLLIGIVALATLYFLLRERRAAAGTFAEH